MSLFAKCVLLLNGALGLHGAATGATEMTKPVLPPTRPPITATSREFSDASNRPDLPDEGVVEREHVSQTPGSGGGQQATYKEFELHQKIAGLLGARKVGTLEKMEALQGDNLDVNSLLNQVHRNIRDKIAGVAPKPPSKHMQMLEMLDNEPEPSSASLSVKKPKIKTRSQS